MASIKVPTNSDLQYRFKELRLGESYKWRFTEANSAMNGHGRFALGLFIEATKTSEGLRVLLGEEDGNYAGGSWAGLFTDPHSAAFFAYALVKRFSNTELDGTMEERNGIY